MDTMYLLFKFLHVVAAIVWIGGILALAVLNARMARTGDPAAMAALGQQSAFFGRVAIGPAMLVILIAGLGMVGVFQISFGALWIIWGLIGVVASGALSVIAGRTAATFGTIGAGAGPDDPRLGAIRGRLATLNVINLTLLASVVWAMVFKPTL